MIKFFSYGVPLNGYQILKQIHIIEVEFPIPCL